MKSISSCPNCGNSKKGQKAKKCSQCGTITCQKCSFTGCVCGSCSYSENYEIS